MPAGASLWVIDHDESIADLIRRLAKDYGMNDPTEGVLGQDELFEVRFNDKHQECFFDLSVSREFLFSQRR